MKTYIQFLRLSLVFFVVNLNGQASANCCNTCCHYPFSCGMAEAYISAEILYLKACEGDLHCNGCFSLEDCNVPQASIPDTSIIVTKGFHRSCKDKAPHFKWDTGYRFGIGGAFQNCPWEIAATYTYFHSKTHRHHKHLKEIDRNGSLIPISDFFPKTYQHHKNLNEIFCSERPKSDWNLKLKYADFIVSYKTSITCLPCNFVFKPYVGLRAAAINQRLHKPFREIIPLQSIPQSFIVTKSHSSSSTSSSIDSLFRRDGCRQQFSGVGLLIGAEILWNTDYCLTFYAKGDIGNLIGRYHTSFRSHRFIGPHIFECHNNDGQQISQFFLDSGIGVRWNTCVCGDLNLILQLGYEYHRFFDYNHLSGSGDLCLQGGTLSATLEY